jgi:hypothetical protein
MMSVGPLTKWTVFTRLRHEAHRAAASSPANLQFLPPERIQKLTSWLSSLIYANDAYLRSSTGYPRRANGCELSGRGSLPHEPVREPQHYSPLHLSQNPRSAPVSCYAADYWLSPGPVETEFSQEDGSTSNFTLRLEIRSLTTVTG